jgi:glutathione peroxidase
MPGSLLDIPATLISGAESALGAFPARAYLVVNTASKCGFAPQYQGLERLWQRYGERGLVVVGFPCNQFGGQEPGTEAQISQFCELNFGVTFPLFRKVEVNGPGAHPLFTALKQRAPGVLGTTRIKWNFTKFLLDGAGQQVQRFAPTTRPERMEKAIEAFLG